MNEGVGITARGMTALINLAMFVRDLPMKAEYIQEPDGSITCSVECPDMCANGKNKLAAEMELIKILQDHAESYIENLPEWTAGRPDEFMYIYKILLLSTEELIKCLRGGN